MNQTLLGGSQVPDDYEGPRCKVCSIPAPNEQAWFKFGRFRIPLCEVCGMSALNLARLVVRLRDELKTHGILVGIPK